jgi:hypothetical protein
MHSAGRYEFSYKKTVGALRCPHKKPRDPDLFEFFIEDVVHEI